MKKPIPTRYESITKILEIEGMSGIPFSETYTYGLGRDDRTCRIPRKKHGMETLLKKPT